MGRDPGRKQSFPGGQGRGVLIRGDYTSSSSGDNGCSTIRCGQDRVIQPDEGGRDLGLRKFVGFR